MFGPVEALIVDLNLREVICSGSYGVVRSMYEQMKEDDPYSDHLVFSVCEDYYPGV